MARKVHLSFIQDVLVEGQNFDVFLWMAFMVETSYIPGATVGALPNDKGLFLLA